MKKIRIEWQHYSKKGKTCDRCSGTKVNLDIAIRELRKKLHPKGIEIELTKKILPKGQISQSNIILINGAPLEKIFPNTTKGESECCSCGDLCGKPTDCRTINKSGIVYEKIPVSIIKEAVFRILNM